MREEPGRELGKVFLCHASEDKPVVKKLFQQLVDDGFSPWLDEENILPGEDWKIEIRKAVRSADIVLVCLSRHSAKRGYVQKEIKLALDVADEQPEGTIFLIPVRLEECVVPERLLRWQYVNLYEENGYERLKESLRLQIAAQASVPLSTSSKRVGTSPMLTLVKKPAIFGERDSSNETVTDFQMATVGVRNNGAKPLKDCKAVLDFFSTNWPDPVTRELPWIRTDYDFEGKVTLLPGETARLGTLGVDLPIDAESDIFFYKFILKTDVAEVLGKLRILGASIPKPLEWNVRMLLSRNKGECLIAIDEIEDLLPQNN